MKRNLLFFCSGALLGAFIFWLPAIISGMFFFSPFENLFPWLMGSWFLPALPYVLIAFVLGMVWAILKRDDLKERSLNVLSFCAGLYLSLSFFSWFLAVSFHFSL